MASRGVKKKRGRPSQEETAEPTTVIETPQSNLLVVRKETGEVVYIQDEGASLKVKVVGPNAGQGPPQFYSPPPPGPPPHQAYMTSYQPTPPYPPVMSPPLTQPSPPPHSYHKNDRNLRQHEKMRNKFYQRHQPLPHHHFSTQPQPIHLKTQTNATIHHTPPISPKKEVSSVHVKDGGDEKVNGDVHDAPPQVSLQELLSQIKPPEINGIGPYSATAQWAAPDLSPLASKGLSVGVVRFEVFLNNSHYDTVTATHVNLANLRPGTEYKIYLICQCNGVKGYPTQRQSFFTKPAAPDPPPQPRPLERKKNSIMVKWTAPKDNGAKIFSYSLEICGGQFSVWTPIYQNRSKEFTIGRLKPQTDYRFRVSACNEVGSSDFSPELLVSTLGLAPTQPEPPLLEEASTNSLKMGWPRRPCDDTFSLEMEDVLNDYGFLPVFSGTENSFTCVKLRRNVDYKFRLCSQNKNGKSPYSEIACYRTLPDVPQPPSAPQLKGKPLPDRVTMTWHPPLDHGGTPVSCYVVQLDKGMGFQTIYSGANLECEASGLAPGTSYKARCQAESAGGKSKWGPEGVLTTKPVVPGQCRPPKLLGKAKAHTLQLKWGYPDFDGGSSVTEFNLEMISPDSERRQVYLGSALECTVASLLPGRAYMFLLRAVNRIGAGPWSDPLEVLSGAGPPDTMRPPRLACKSPHVVDVTWDEPINNGATVDQYLVQMAEVSNPHTESSESSSTCGEPDSELNFGTAYAGSLPHAEVRNLTPATTYAFRVSASNVAGSGAFSSTASVTTPAAPPASVGHVSSNVEATEVTLHWTEPHCHGDPITHYNIEVGGGNRVFTTHGPQLEYCVQDLLPETTYKFRIQAVNSVGLSHLSSPHKVTTLPLPPRPPQVELVKASYNTLRLKWGEGRNLELLKYSLQMEYLNPHNNTMEFYQIYCGTNQTFKVGKLEENTSYRFRICASNEAGMGPYSTAVVFTTTKAPPPPLKAPRISEGPQGTYCVEWCGVRCPGEDKILYRLQVLQAGKDQDYNLVYFGSETSFIMSSLPAQTGHYVRVCGVRMNGDKEVVAGAYSSPTLFNTPKKEEAEPTSGPECATKERKFEWGSMTDHQKAFAILMAFSVFAFILAYVLSPTKASRPAMYSN